MSRPMKMNARLASYVGRKMLQGVRRFPLVTMIEVLEQCNLRCTGCGRIREYSDVLDQQLSVEETLQAARDSGAPVVSITGGEPLLHPQIDEIVSQLMDEGFYIYLCTNGLLLEDKLSQFEPSSKLAFAVHLDGTAEVHDKFTNNEGTFDTALSALKKAISAGFRVTTNTTIFKGSDPQDLHQLFHELDNLGIEGIMLAPGYSYESVEEQDQFLAREESIEVFREILDPDKTNGIPFYNSPIFLDFLRGRRNLTCTAWAAPTYTVKGWRKPCYVIADEHVDEVNALMDETLWKKYGVGNDYRCASCMVHSGFDTASVIDSLRSPSGAVDLIKSAVPDSMKRS